MDKRTFIQVFLGAIVGFVCMLPAKGYAQLGANMSSTVNTHCNGAPCDYQGPSIIINELMMSPTQFDGSLWGGSATQRGEWIELYNPNICESIDISCYYLGNNANDSDPFPGGYVIPSGTVVPPAGFALIRGVNADPVPANLLLQNGGNVIELVVDGTGVCVGGGSRLWFPNVGGWFAFYDSNGIPQDAVSWGNQSNLNQDPCIPALAGCAYSGSLPNYQGFPADRKNYILNTSAADFQGQSIRRMPDGAAWDGPGTPTYATNNAPPPIPPIIICNGTASAQPFGGTPPYTFQWDDPQFQTTEVATDLCAGDYCVLITDANNNTFQQCVTVEDISYEIIVSAGMCAGESYTLPDNSVVTAAGAYPVLLESGFTCDSLITVNLEVYPEYSFELNPQICENHTYTLPDGTEVDATGTYLVNFQTINGCDSIYTVNLLVTNPIGITIDVAICEGTSYALPNGTEVSDEGFYQVLVSGDPTACDTLFDVNISFYLDFQISINEQDDISCAGEADGSILLSVAGTSSPYTFVWSDGIDHQTAANDLPPGDYTIQITDVNGCEKDTTLTIAAPLPIEISLLGDTLICLSAEAQLLAEANGGTGSLVYHWNLSNADSGNIGVSPAEFTVYSVYAEDENGCISETLEIEIAVITMDIGLLIVSNDTAICPGETVSIYGAYNGNYPPYTFVWSAGVGNGEGPHAVSPDEPTTYTLTVSDACGNSLSADVVVDVFEMPEVVLLNDLLSGCRPLNIELSDPINSTSGFIHEWIFSNGDTYIGNPVNTILDEPGIYDVSLRVTSPDGCSSLSETTVAIEVYDVPVAGFTASAWSTTIEDPEITFTDISTGSVINSWTIDGSTFENQTEISYTFNDIGSYAISLFVENEFGCRDSVSQSIAITIDYDIDVPNAFTPGSNGGSPFYDPNSMGNTIFYPFVKYAKEYRMSIFNRWGELIFESTELEMGWNGTYRSEPCPQDVYVYKIELVFADGKEATKVGDVTLFR